MDRVRYVGPFDEVIIPSGPFNGVTVKRGEVAEVPGELIAGLLEQPANFQAVEDEPVKAKSETKKGGDR